MRVFLDASVLIRAVERPRSDAARTVDRVFARSLEAVVDEVVLDEVERFFREHRDRSFAWLYTEQIRRNARVVMRGEARARQPGLSARLNPNARLHRGAAAAGNVEAIVGGDEPDAARDDAAQGVYTRRDLWRSLLISAFVGTVLVLLNVRATSEGPDYVRIILNYFVPFTVASVSAIFANHARNTAATP